MIIIIRINGHNRTYDFTEFLNNLKSGGYHIEIGDYFGNWKNEMYQVKGISLNPVKDIAYVDVEKHIVK